MMTWFRNLTNRKRAAAIALAAAAMAGLAIWLVGSMGGLFNTAPTVTIQTPGRKSASDREAFSVELQLSGLREELYPAASFSISFDNTHLEFLGIEEGNVMTLAGMADAGYQLPQWGVNVERSNQVGQINLMYLDATGGQYAFTKDALAGQGNVIVRLCFRLRGSARSGDVYELYLEDAVFAANDETKSLTQSMGTLRTKNGRIAVGDET